jgi:hypothetical protein
MPTEPSDPAHDIRLRTLLSSWKLSRGFRAVGARHYRKRRVPHSSQTELNREFGDRGQKSTAGWFFLALLVLAAIDYLYLYVVPSSGL